MELEGSTKVHVFYISNFSVRWEKLRITEMKRENRSTLEHFVFFFQLQHKTQKPLKIVECYCMKIGKLSTMNTVIGKVKQHIRKDTCNSFSQRAHFTNI